jgi:hypothetical protein
MSSSSAVAETAIGNTAARLFLATVGAMAIAWALAVFPVFWSEIVIIDVARAVMAGDVFKPEILGAVEARTETNNLSMRRSSVLGKAAVIRLRQAEDAMRVGNPELIDQKLASLDRIVDQALRNAPNDSFLWLANFWLDTTRNGLGPESLRFLRMSYELGPHEGWIAVKRDRIALAAFPALPSDLSELAISEFVGLVRWGLVSEAAEIAGGPGLPLRSILFPRLAELTIDERRRFAGVWYQRELDDVQVPGVNPPAVGIPMPVLPPDF